MLIQDLKTKSNIKYFFHRSLEKSLILLTSERDNVTRIHRIMWFWDAETA